MSYIENIQSFLQQAINQNNSSPYKLAREIRLGGELIRNILNKGIYPTLDTCLSITQYFECSLDELFGREKYITNTEDLNIQKVDIIYYVNSLKDFIRLATNKSNMSYYKLAYTIGFSDRSISNLMYDKKKTLGLKIMIAVADYFEVSLDKMIGRIKKPSYEMSSLID